LGLRARGEHRGQGVLHLDEFRRSQAHRDIRMTAAASVPCTRRRQAGLGLVNLIIAAIVVAIVVIVLMPAIPGFIEYRAIVSAVNKSAQDGSGTPEGIRRAFDRYAAIDDITSIKGADLVIERSPDGPV